MLAAAHGHCGHGGGWYLLSGLGRQTRQSIAEQFQLNLQLGADRVESAVEASRPPSYDPELRDAWNQYRRDQEYAPLYRRCSALFSRLYQSDSRFRYAVFGFSRTPEELSIVVPGSSAGLLSNQVRDQWREDLPAVLGLAEGLDSSVGFLRQGGELYLVRNLMDSNYQAIGVLALALDPDYFFGDLALLPWVSSVTVDLGRDSALTVKGEPLLSREEGALECSVRQADFTLRGRAAVDRGVLMAGFRTYPWLLGAMALSLLLLGFTFRFFRQKISRPIQALMEGAAHIRRGELARRDAQIKALQAHINPHFLNNTLEIINWQARTTPGTSSLPTARPSRPRAAPPSPAPCLRFPATGSNSA